MTSISTFQTVNTGEQNRKTRQPKLPHGGTDACLMTAYSASVLQKKDLFIEAKRGNIIQLNPKHLNPISGKPYSKSKLKPIKSSHMPAEQKECVEQQYPVLPQLEILGSKNLLFL